MLILRAEKEVKMIENIAYSAQTGDAFNPIVIVAVAAASLAALAILLFGTKRKK